MSEEVLFSNDKPLNNGEIIAVEVTGITREITLQDLLAFTEARGLSAEKVRVVPECDGMESYCGATAERHIEIWWKADSP